jgi:hypothetical protein
MLRALTNQPVLRLRHKVANLPVLPKRVRNFADSDTGPFTVYFWAGCFKWGIVMANIGELRRDPKLLSWKQQLAIGSTGLVWIRYCTQVKPVSYNLIAVNTFMALTGFYQLGRIVFD